MHEKTARLTLKLDAQKDKSRTVKKKKFYLD